ncbi:MAG: hypothetical protein KGK02_11440 [Rhodospirillales bacterium]|nr:hypothetical protein [Rhodospirillales bacterium]
MKGERSEETQAARARIACRRHLHDLIKSASRPAPISAALDARDRSGAPVRAPESSSGASSPFSWFVPA